jgi:hypothetical protein
LASTPQIEREGKKRRAGTPENASKRERLEARMQWMRLQFIGRANP